MRQPIDWELRVVVLERDGYNPSPMDWLMEHFGEVREGLLLSALVVAFMILPGFSTATTYGIIALSVVITLLLASAFLSFKKYQRGQ